MTDYKKIAQDTVWVYIFSYVAIFVSYIVRAYYARELTVVDYGLFFGLFSFFYFFTFLRDWGLGAASIFYTKKYLVEGHLSKVKALFFWTHGFTLGISLLLGVLLYLFREIITTTIYKGEGHIDFLFTVFILYWIFETVYKTNLIFFESYQEQPISRFLELLFRILILVFSLWGGWEIHQVPVLAYTIAIISLSILSSAWFMIKHRDIFSAKMYMKRDLLVEVFSYGSLIILGGISGVLLASTDAFLIQVILGAEQVAYYINGQSASQIITMLLLPITIVTVPLFARLWHEKKVQELSRLVNFLFSHIFLILIPVSFFFIAFSQQIILFIYGPGFDASILVLQIFALIVLVKSVNNFLSQLLLATGKPGKSSKITLIAAIVNVVLNLALISIFGIMGAVFATGISFLIVLGLSVRYLKGDLELSFDIVNNIKILLCGFVFLIVAFILRSEVALVETGNLMIDFVINGGIVFGFSSLIYILCLFGLKVLTLEKIEFFLGLFNIKLGSK